MLVKKTEVFKIMDAVLNSLMNFGINYGLKIIGAIIVLIVGLKLVKALTKIVGKGKGFLKLDLAVQRFTLNFTKTALDVIVFITAAVIVGIPITTFVTILASCGLAIGLALQGALGNLAGGLMILIFKPFRIGDYVTAGGESGTVEDITVFYTILTTVDNKRITVPNGNVMNNSVTDYSAKAFRRVDFSFSAGYGDDIDKVKKVLLETASAHPLVKKDPEPFARLSTHSASSLDYALRVWCENADYWKVFFDLNEQVKKAFDANGIEIPFTQVDVHNIQK